jgi:hypothetical protein
MAKSGGGGGVGWLALIVSLVALFFSWKAYERSGGRIGDLKVLNTEVSVGDESPPDWRSALDEAREKLGAARDEIDSKGDLDKVKEDVAHVRENLARSFRNAGEGTRRGWRDLDRNLERLQGQLEKGGSRARETLDETLDKMKRIGS